MSITIDHKKLNSRSSDIRKLLAPLSKNNNSVSARVAISHKGSILFSAFGGTSPINTNHNDWYFKTHNDDYKGAYFEVWLEKNNNYVLEKAYFKLMLIERNNHKEILSLHIDPSERDNKYKMGPHIHLITSIDKVSKAHFSLNLSDLTQILNSYDNFKAAYTNALIMINEEIILK